MAHSSQLKAWLAKSGAMEPAPDQQGASYKIPVVSDAPLASQQHEEAVDEELGEEPRPPPKRQRQNAAGVSWMVLARASFLDFLGTTVQDICKLSQNRSCLIHRHSMQLSTPHFIQSVKRQV